MRTRIRLDTLSDINAFVAAVTSIEERVSLEDDCGHRVSASSLLGAIYSMEWDKVFVTCEKDITSYIMPWMI